MLRGVKPQDRMVEQVVIAMLRARSALQTEHHLGQIRPLCGIPKFRNWGNMTVIALQVKKPDFFPGISIEGIYYGYAMLWAYGPKAFHTKIAGKWMPETLGKESLIPKETPAPQ